MDGKQENGVVIEAGGFGEVKSHEGGTGDAGNDGGHIQVVAFG